MNDRDKLKQLNKIVGNHKHFMYKCKYLQKAVLRLKNTHIKQEKIIQ